MLPDATLVHPPPDPPEHETTGRLLSAIISYKEQHDGCSPSIRWLRDYCLISSTSVVTYHLDKLETQGYIRRGGYGQYGSIEVVGGRWIAPDRN